MKELRIPVGEARKNMASILRRAGKGTRVKLTRYNRTLAGLVSRDDLLQLERCEEIMSGRPKPTSKRRSSDRSGNGSR